MTAKRITIYKNDDRVWDRVIQALEIPLKDETVAQINRIELSISGYCSYRDRNRFRTETFTKERAQ